MNRILVYDGPDDKSMLIGELFGTPYHKVVKSISSLGKSIFIDFKKLYQYGTVEFTASIKDNKKLDSDCQSWLEGTNVLMSPNNPKINCSWLITTKFGSYITLAFSYIEVKSNNNEYYSKNALI